MIFFSFISFIFCVGPSIERNLIRGYFPADISKDRCGEFADYNSLNFSHSPLENSYNGGFCGTYNISSSVEYQDGICPIGYEKIFNVCIPNSTEFQDSAFCNIYTSDYANQCKKQIYLLNESKQAGHVHPLALQYLANLAALNDYQDVNISNYWTSHTSLGAIQPEYGIPYWAQEIPFFTYLDSRDVALSNILEQSHIDTEFQFAEVTQFYLARYTWDGYFIGFTPLTLQLNQCSHKDEVSQIWRKYGTNYITSCYFDLPTFSREAGNEFYEIFLGDGQTEDGITMYPIPVMINNKPVRRFYRFNNQTTENGQNVTKFINGVTIRFDLTNGHSVPYFTISYRSVLTSNLNEFNSDVSFNSDSDQHPEYKFEVIYQMSTSNFNQVFMILSIVLGVLAFVFMIGRIFFVALVDGKYGLNGIAFAKILVAVFDTCGLFFLILTLSFATFVLIFFKFQKAVFWCLPEESFKVFKLMKTFVICSLAFEIASNLLSVFVLPMNNNFIIMDWESSKSKKVPVSAWRRINVANELNRLSTIRSYNLAFTVIVVAFILTGFDVELLSTPIPSPQLISTGYSHWVLRYAISAIIWLLVMLLQYMFYNFLYWRFYGNPFFNFLDLCTTSNLSLFVFTSPSHGYYLHGRSVQSHSDVEMKKLAQALIDEEEGIVGLRGLLPNTTEQVFEVFFSREFSQIAVSNLQRIEMSRMPSGLGKVTARDFSKDSFAAYGEMNTFLKKFIDGSDENKYIVQPPELLQIIFQVPPQIMNDSIMNKVSDSYYKVSLMGGTEWGLMIMYLLLFCVVDILTKSPSIGGFVVYIVDGIIKRIYAKMFRVRLAKSSLLDSRFLLS